MKVNHSKHGYNWLLTKMWIRLLVRYFLLGTSRLMFLTASYILIVLFSLLSRFSKASLILLGFFHFSWYCECESLSYFFLFLVIFFAHLWWSLTWCWHLSDSTTGAEYLGLYFFSLYGYNLGFSQLMLLVLL